MNTCEEIIESMVAAIGANASERDKHMFREALHGLVRLAKAEQLLSIQRDFHRVSQVTSLNYRRQA